MRVPRGLTPEEAELWARVASTVKPLAGKVRQAKASTPAAGPTAVAVPDVKVKLRGRIPPPPVAPSKPAAPPRPLDRDGLDASWERKLSRGVTDPDFTLDLHGHTLDSAHARLDMGLTQALAQGARVVLLITGKPRPIDDHADRGSRRGVIRAKMLDWLAAGPHASRIAAVRGAHPRHGGAGAVYIVLRRAR